jgi:hypothetical protein
MRAGPRVLLALLGLALGLVLAESAVRLTGGWLCADVPGVVVQADETFGWRQRPNLRGWATLCRGRPVPPTLVETDGRGFVNPGRPIEKRPGTARILLLGGNVPQAFGVPWAFSLAGMLEGRADARRGVTLEVVNGAMGSFSLDQDLALLRAEGGRVAPDLVLAVVDAVVETTSLSPGLIAMAGLRPPAKPYYDVVDGTLVPLATAEPEPSPPLEPPARGLLAWSHLYRLLRGLPADVGPPQRWLQVQPLPSDHLAEAARAERVLHAVLTALRDEAARLRAPFALVVVPPPRAPRFGEVTPGHKLVTVAHDVGIPILSLTFAFQSLPGLLGNPGYVPETTRFNADGHFVASNEIWKFLERQQLLPPGVVAVRAPAGGRVAPLEPFPDALLTVLRMQQTGWVVRMVVAGLAGVVLSWMLAPLPARARDWATLGASLVPIALLTGPVGVAGAVGFALLFWLAGGTPWRSVNRLLLALVTVAAVILPLLWLARLPTDVSVPIRFYVAAATVMGVVRGLSYAASHRRLRLVEHLVGMLFFPTFASGPIVSASALARARDRSPVPATVSDVVRHLGRAGVGGLRVAWGAAKLLVAPLVLNLVTPDVIASSGDAVSRLRLWAWLFETSIYFWAVYGGLSDVGIGLAAMVGVRIPENFVRPWAAITPRAFWWRTLVTVTGRIRGLVAVPIARRAGTPAGVLVSFLVGALWYSVSVLALYGVYAILVIRPGAWAGLALWATIHAAGVVGFDRMRTASRSVAARVLGCAATQLLVALAWVPLLAFPFATLGTILRIYARLVGFR